MKGKREGNLVNYEQSLATENGKLWNDFEGILILMIAIYRAILGGRTRDPWKNGGTSFHVAIPWKLIRKRTLELKGQKANWRKRKDVIGMGHGSVD
jgi:hypothetical protein